MCHTWHTDFWKATQSRSGFTKSIKQFQNTVFSILSTLIAILMRNLERNVTLNTRIYYILQASTVSYKSINY